MNGQEFFFKMQLVFFQQVTFLNIHVHVVIQNLVFSTFVICTLRVKNFVREICYVLYVIILVGQNRVSIL